MSATMDWSSQGGSAPDAYQTFLAPAMFEPFAERLVDDAGIVPGNRVLDVACGTGVVARAAAIRAGPEGAVTGVDLGAPMLAIARQHPAGADAAPIEYRAGKADELPVGDGGFDVATCQQGLQFFEDRPAALRAIRSALSPGGRLAVSTWGPIRQNAGFAAIGDALDRHLGEEAASMIRSPFSLGDPAELASLIEDAGFTEVRAEPLTLTASFAARDDFATRVLKAGPVWPLFSEAPKSAQEAVDAEVAAALESHATDDGVSFPMTTIVGLARA